MHTIEKRGFRDNKSLTRIYQIEIDFRMYIEILMHFNVIYSC